MKNTKRSSQNASMLMRWITDKDTMCYTHVDAGTSIKQDQLWESIVAAAELLHPKTKVLLYASNGFAWISFFVASLITGKELFALDHNASHKTVNAIIKEHNIEAVICEDEQSMLPCDQISISLLKERAGHTGYAIEQSLCDGSLVLFTTGTTGIPKGVMMPLSKIIKCTMAIQELYQIDKNEAMLIITPFSHSMGMILLLLSIAFSNELVMVNRLEYLNEALGKQVSIAAFPPVVLKSIIQYEHMRERLRELRFVICGGAGMSVADYRTLYAEKIKIYNGYGMTECVAAIAVTNAGTYDGTDLLTPLSCCAIKLSPDNEIIVKGETVNTSYLDGKPIIGSDGWYHTHDIGEYVDGRIRVSYRMDAVKVLSNGFKVNLTKIENVICQISEVQDAQVYINSAHERLEASVVLRPGYTQVDVLGLCKKINDELEYYEQIQHLSICETLKTVRGKKTYGR